MKRPSTHPQHPQLAACSRTGMVLLLTLIILAMAASWLSILASRAVRVQAHADEAERDLQARWAQQSIQDICLHNAEAILRGREGAQLAPSTPWIPVVIAGQAYQISVADEQAKANIGFLLSSKSLAQVVASLRTIAPKGRANLVELRFAQGSSEQADPVLVAYAQLWLDANPEDLFGNSGQPGLQQQVTLWGDGRINLGRASDDAAIEALRGALTRSETLSVLQVIRSDPAADPQAVLGQLDLSIDQKEMAMQLIAKESFCHSVTIRSEHADGHIGWRFAVQCVQVHEDPKINHGQVDLESELMETRVWVQIW